MGHHIEYEKEEWPEIDTTWNWVQECQSHLGWDSAAPVSYLHVPGQTESTVATTHKQTINLKYLTL